MLSKSNSIFILTVLVGVVSSEIYFKSRTPHVKLTSGAILSGSIKFSRDGRPFSSFIGIPYATVPERFSESEPIKEPWNGVRRAVQPGSVCPQKLMGPSDVHLGEEDCLYANVFVPMNNTGKKGHPVMVWIYGGGFHCGDGLNLYNPQYFMDEDVILVSFNYRLGVFGFLSTGDEVVPGNNGLKDQVMALRWVQENIRNFNGDPNKVTIFGESAGAASVHYLVLSPQTKGLFHRAIAQSGSALGAWAHEHNPKENAVKLAKFLDCPTAEGDPYGISSVEILTCLRGKTTDELNRAQNLFRDSWPLNYWQFYFMPTREPEVTPSSKHTPFITQSPWSIVNDKTKSLSHVPIMFGATEDEGIDMFATTIMENPKLIEDVNTKWEELFPLELHFDKINQSSQFFKPVSRLIKKLYFKNDKIIQGNDEDTLGMTNLFSDGLILHAVYRAAIETALRSTKPSVYLYRFSYPSVISFVGKFLGLKTNSNKVGHGDELPFLFNMNGVFPGVPTILKENSPEEMFSKNFVRMWTSFAQFGEPKHVWGSSDPLSSRWHPISKNELDGSNPLKWYNINNDPKNEVIDDSIRERIALWDTIWDEFINAEVMKDSIMDRTEL